MINNKKGALSGLFFLEFRFWVLVLAVSQPFFSCGLIYGWGGMLLILKGEHTYDFKCDQSSSTSIINENGIVECVELDTYLNFISAIVVSSQMFFAFLGGFLIDYIGPKFMTVSQVLITVGTMLMAAAEPSKSDSVDFFLVGLILQNCTGLVLAPSLVHYAYLYPAAFYFTCALMSSSVGVSSIVFPVLHKIWESTVYTRSQILWVYSSILSLYLIFSFIQPMHKMTMGSTISFKWKTLTIQIHPPPASSTNGSKEYSYSDLTNSSLPNQSTPTTELHNNSHNTSTLQNPEVLVNMPSLDTNSPQSLFPQASQTRQYSHLPLAQNHFKQHSYSMNTNTFPLSSNYINHSHSYPSDKQISMSSIPNSVASMQMKSNAQPSSIKHSTAVVNPRRGSMFSLVRRDIKKLLISRLFVFYLLFVVFWAYVFLFYLTSVNNQLFYISDSIEYATTNTELFSWIAPLGFIGSLMAAYILNHWGYKYAFIFHIIIGLIHIIVNLSQIKSIQFISFLTYTLGQEATFACLFSFVAQFFPIETICTMLGAILTIQGLVMFTISPFVSLILSNDSTFFIPNLTFLVIGILSFAVPLLFSWDSSKINENLKFVNNEREASPPTHSNDITKIN